MAPTSRQSGRTILQVSQHDGGGAAQQARHHRPSAKWLSIGTPAVFVVVVFVLPVIFMFSRSWTNFPSAGQGGFDNFGWFFGSSVQLAVLRRTVTTALTVTLVCIGLGFPYAYLMTIATPRVRSAMLLMVLVPFWTSLIVRTYVWIVLLADNGPVNDVLGATPIGDHRIIGTTFAVVIGMSQTMLPMMILPVYASISKIDRRLLDAATSLGARPGNAFRKVYLPLAIPGLAAGSLLVFVLALGFYFTPKLLGSPSNSLISNQIVQQTQGQLAFGRGAAMSIVLLILTLVLLGISALAVRRYSSHAKREGLF